MIVLLSREQTSCVHHPSSATLKLILVALLTSCTSVIQKQHVQSSTSRFLTYCGRNLVWRILGCIPTSAAVICKGVRDEVTLNDTGIIKIDQSCTIKTRKITLRPILSQQQTILATFNKAVHLNVTTKTANRTFTLLI